MFVPRESNVGGRSLINSTVNSHWDALYKAKATFKLPDKMRIRRIKPLIPNKKEIFETHQHLRNLMNLHTKIQQIGRWQDRLKNPCDPVAYPALFFRKVSRAKSKDSLKTKIKQRPKTSGTSKSFSVKKRNLSEVQEIAKTVPIQKLKKLLPNLTSFQNSDIKRYTEALVRAVQHFKIRSPEELQQLQRAALQCVPEDYPSNFESILRVVITQIGKHL